jgi:hypothetical protein
LHTSHTLSQLSEEQSSGWQQLVPWFGPLLQAQEPLTQPQSDEQLELLELLLPLPPLDPPSSSPQAVTKVAAAKIAHREIRMGRMSFVPPVTGRRSGNS